MLKSAKGLSLIEVLVAAVIMTLTIGGLVNIFVSAKRYLVRSQSKIAAAQISKYFVDPLQAMVRQDEWFAGGNCLAGDISDCPAAETINGIAYTPQYDITPVDPSMDYPLGRLRRVKLTLTWEESLP